MDQRSLYFLQQMNIDVWQHRSDRDALASPALLVVTDTSIDEYKALLQGICMGLSIEWSQMRVVTSRQCPVEHTGWLLWSVSSPCPIEHARLLSSSSLADICRSGQLKRQLWERVCHYVS